MNVIKVPRSIPNWLATFFWALFSACSQSYNTDKVLAAAFVDTTRQVAATLIYPAKDGHASTADTFTWTGAPEARAYIIEFSTNADMSSPALSTRLSSANYVIKSSDATASSGLLETQYYWRITTVFPLKQEKSAVGRFTLFDPETIYVDQASTAPNETGNKSAPFKSVQTGINFAKANNKKNVHVSKGDYGPVQILSGIRLKGGFDATNNWQRDISANLTRLLTSSENAVVSCALNATSDSLVEGFTLRNSKFNPTPYAINCEYASPTFANVTVTNSVGCNTFGGVIRILGGAPTIQLSTFVAFSGNIIDVKDSNVTIEDSTITLTQNLSCLGSQVIKLDNSSATIRRNSISATNSNLNDTFNVIFATNNSSATILSNTISGVSVATIKGTGITLNASAAVIVNNLINPGGSSSGNGIELATSTSSATIVNNTIYGGSGAANSTGLQLNGPAIIRNNIIFTNAATTQRCVNEAAASGEPTAFESNNLFGCSTMYRDVSVNMVAPCGAAINGFTGSFHTGAAGTVCNSAPNSIQNTNPPSGNISIDNAGNQLFVDLLGADANITTMADNIWKLTTNPAICTARAGGQNLSAVTAIDRDGLARTVAAVVGCVPVNSGAANWSIGAYESD